MRRFYLLGFLLLLSFDALAQISFKYAAMGALPVTADLAWLGRVLAQPWVYVALCGYLGAFFTWMALLRHAPIGPAFAASHLEVLVVMVLAVPLFGEHLGWAQILGGTAILAGIVCLALSETDEPEAGAAGTHAGPGPHRNGMPSTAPSPDAVPG